MPSLYVVATPIGNLEDITLRALRILREVGLIAAEDTRKTRRLLSHYDIKTPMTSFYEHSKLTKLDYILNFLENKDVAIVSEAGMPGISDPGYELITAAIDREIPVVPVPGPSAVITALAVSGLPAERFTYIGFLPHKQSDRRKQLKSVAGEPGVIVAFETPHRAQAALADILSVLGDRRIAVCRELTKLHEEIYRGTVAGAIAHFTGPRGEFTLIIEGNKEKGKLPEIQDTRDKVAALVNEGASAKEAVAIISNKTGMPRRELYRLFIEMKNKNE
jgi:16S rRNA (cytidine1402-2'-O)-methyltransferase